MSQTLSPVELLRGLVAIPSLSGKEHDAAAWLVGRMRDLGYDRAYVDEAGNAVGELGPQDAGRVVVLLGHVDTVPGEIPVRLVGSEDPEQPGEVLYGRGSVDAKGPLAAFTVAAARTADHLTEEHDLRLLVVGAVEEEAATSKGARFLCDRFDGKNEPVPEACIIGEPSRWHRVTLGYKGRLLIDLEAHRPMSHTAGPDPGVATVATDLWGLIVEVAARDRGEAGPFERLLPSLRRVVTDTDPFAERVSATYGLRLPLGFDVDELLAQVSEWAQRRAGATQLARLDAARATELEKGEESRLWLQGPELRIDLCFRGYEPAIKSERNTHLVRAFLGAIREVGEGQRPGFVVKTGTSDMNVVAPRWGCPILAYGPGDSALDHTPDEHLSIVEYYRAIDVLEKALLRLLPPPG